MLRTSLTLVGLLACALLCLSAPAPATTHTQVQRAADVRLSVAEALELAFGSSEVTKETRYLDENQRARAEELAGEELASAVARPYVARDADGALVGVAWFDTHQVRTKRETLMTAVDARGRVLRVEVLAFAEPSRYLPKATFYEQFQGEELDDELVLDGDVRNVAGATMTSRATVEAARRALALHAVLFPPAADGEEGDGEDGDGGDGAEPTDGPLGP
ncbi:Electron transport complex subunit RsxG [Planctomycetes bacterium Pla163]|uniref:Electron transport complex subunit RsxG n=1 Tax=Rohdeia mirabilis TaxID=2528008 RepID=A0A518CY73_9BACT|nr:Electron transport complex subunit RsxG [Planctomycetes bacterium Pla163]